MKRITALLLIIMMLGSLSFTAFADEAETNAEIINNTRKTIEVNNIIQYPELPTGCESVALAILLNHLGFPADKMEIARNYLPKMEFYWVDGQLYGADFKTTFAGNPESENAYGCYAPCIVTAANSYLHDKGYNAQVYDLTETSFDTLLANYIDNDIPVLIWITGSNLHEPVYTDKWKTPAGDTVQWLAYEHCVVLTGYDREKSIIYVSDPQVGNTSYDYDKIKQRYIDLGKQSVYIQKLQPKSESLILGDLDRGGKITSADALFALRLSVGLEKLTDENMLLADVDFDGKITSADSLSILRGSVGIMDNDKIGKTVEISVVGDWTFKTNDVYTNMSLHEDGTASVLKSNNPSAMIGNWIINNNIVTVKVSGEDYIYTFLGNTLVSSSDNSVVFVRGTPNNEEPAPKPDEKENNTQDTPDKADTPDHEDKPDSEETPEKPITRKLINVENISQLPELPTGCETVSLTMVLKYLGYPADKMDIARNYLPKQPFYYKDGELYGADFRTTFAGDPEDPSSYGCYAPCIVTTANKYLEAKGYKGKAYDVTATDFEKLLTDYIDKDIPLIIWITNNGLQQSSLSTVWKTPDGKSVQWRRPEHSVVLTGYDREKKLVYVSDPKIGNQEYDYDLLVTRFKEMEMQAVYIDNSADIKK